MGFIYNGQWVPDASDLENQRDRTIRRAQRDPEFADAATIAFLQLFDKDEKSASREKVKGE